MKFCKSMASLAHFIESDHLYSGKILTNPCVMLYTDSNDSRGIGTLLPFLMLWRGMIDRSAELMSLISEFFIRLGENV